MKYKKNLKSNKKIKGGFAIANEATKTMYGLYILANIYLKYCIQFRIWCINFFSSTSTDIKTDTSITQFLDMYFTNFEDIYKTTIARYEYKDVININNEGFDIELFARAILRKYSELFFKHTEYSGSDFKPYMNIDYIKSKLKLFKEINIIVSCDNSDLKEKLYELYALYIIALSNDELFLEIRTIYNKLYKFLYYNKSQINEEVIRNCIDFYNNVLYQLLFFDMLKKDKDKYFKNSDDIETNSAIIRSTIYDQIIQNINTRTLSKFKRKATLLTFFQTYDSNINDEIRLFVTQGIDDIINLSNESDQATSDSFDRDLSFDYDCRLFLILDQFIKYIDISLEFTDVQQKLLT